MVENGGGRRGERSAARQGGIQCGAGPSPRRKGDDDDEAVTGGGAVTLVTMPGTLVTVTALLALLLLARPLHAAPPQTVRADAAGPLRLQIVHLNDFHARFEPVSPKASECKAGDRCIGGLARVAAAVQGQLARNPNALVLNGGDNFQGTLWYSLFRWNGTAHFMRQLPWDALTIGNHEFDHGIDGLTPFLENMVDKDGKRLPFVIANMDDSAEPRMKDLWVPSVIVEKDGHRIGIVGYIWKDTPTIAQTEKLKFTDELEALDAEAEKLQAQGVDIIVGLSHAGIEVDLAVAAKSKYADVIVGAHSHTLLYNGTAPDGEKPYGPYPEVVHQEASGRIVLVVQASAYTKFLGNLFVQFDDRGEVESWDGQPIYMDADLPQDDAMVEEMKPWKAEVEAQGSVVVGSTFVELDKLTYSCYNGECTLGNFVADAMVDWYAGKGPEGTWTAAPIAFINAGGLRSNIAPGDITYGDLIAAQPFENTVDLVDLEGRYLLETLEDTVDSLTLLQWSGLRVVYDYSKPRRQQVVLAEVRCAACSIPEYQPIKEDEVYTIAAPSFIIEGGDNFVTFRDKLTNRRPGPVDTDVFLAYLKHCSPLVTEMEGRISVRSAEAFREAVAARHRRAPRTIFY
ncbi:Apyrase [Frankliniella fusca]|uniref:Apyrase n=1 Tax=Frankliniella fusca TaxID=407009 RepID=A0AAE1HQ26_9NEOP|nr:Apyrase [Frankliniella fusca]